MRAYCDVCGAERDCRVVQRDETYPVKGEPITVRAQVMVCNECGEDLFNAELDEGNLERAFQEYRRTKGLMAPEDIVAIREKYGLSQRGLAALLSWSPATVARYEAGALPSVPHNEQIRRFRDDVDYAKELFGTRKDHLGRLERSRVESTLRQFPEDDPPQDLLLQYLMSKYSAQEDEFRGRCQFDVDKAANMIVFFASNMRNVAKSKLLKLLWYADFVAYRRAFKSISGMAYCHNYYGPIPMEHEVLIWYIQSNGLIDLKPHDSGKGDCVEAIDPFDDSLFTDEELQVLEDVCARFKSSTAKGMTKVSHLEDAYVRTQMKEPISYDYAMNLKAIQ